MAMPIEIRMLLWSVVLGLLQLVIATALATKDQGLAYNLSPRDLPAPAVSTVSARMLRASHNFRETFLFFAAAVIALSLLGKATATSALGAQLYFWARVLYVPAYAAGIPVLRTLIWNSFGGRDRDGADCSARRGLNSPLPWAVARCHRKQPLGGKARRVSISFKLCLNRE